MFDDDRLSLAELTTRMKMSMMLHSVPGFGDALLAYLAGTPLDPIEKLARAILRRDPIYSDDIMRGPTGVTEIGGLKVDEYTPQGYPSRIGGRRVEYGIFGIPVRMEGVFSDLPNGPEPSYRRRMNPLPWDV